MKKLLLIAICCCCIYIASGQTVPASGKYQNDLATDHLKGSIKSVESFFYSKPIVGSLTNITEWRWKDGIVYNKQGNIISNVTKTINNNGTDTTFTKYDEQGRAISTTDRSGKIRTRSVYSYNDKHQLVENLLFSATMTMRIVYNEEGQRDTFYNTDIVSKPYSMRVYTYNKVLKTEYEDVYVHDSLESKKIYKFDANGNKIEEIYLDPNNKRTGKSTYQYDNNGNMTMWADSSIMYSRGVVYDPISKSYGSVRYFYYPEFDKAGNWLQKDEFMYNIIVSRVKRKIEYYP